MDTFIPLSYKPGLYRNGTRYQAKGRWYDANGVRFFQDTIQPIGGWAELVDSTGASFTALDGQARSTLTWEKDNGKYVIAIATTAKLYVIDEAVLYDITPSGFAGLATDSAQTDTSVSLYGDGLYGEARYGGTGSGTAQILRAGVWQIDNFGDFLLAVASDDASLYLWDADTSTDATVISEAPACTAVVVTPERFIFALGADNNVRKVAWASQEGYTDWVPTDDNSAGDFELSTQGRLVCGRRSRSQTLLWTNVDFWVASYIGEPFIYRFDLAGSNCGIVSPNACLVIDTMAVWMGQNNFFIFDGFTKPLPCDVHDYVFSDINRIQANKIWAMTISAFGEAWWFYCSGNSTEIDRYVVWNYREGHWSFGELARTAGIDAGATQYPLMIGTDGTMYQHEFAETRTGMTPYLESGPLELFSGPRGPVVNSQTGQGVGDQTMLIQRLIPDERNLGEVRAKLYTALFPTDTETEHGPFSTTQPTFMRARGREVRVRLEEAAGGAGDSWRIGTFRLGVVPSSRR